MHQILPALALIFGSLGGWVLSMRGMGITIQGEDYVNFAEHKGLTGYRIFTDYYLRNAMLPQATGFALALGSVVTSAIVVEGVFGLPGIGSALNDAIQANDFPVIYAIVLMITIAVASSHDDHGVHLPLARSAHSAGIGAFDHGHGGGGGRAAVRSCAAQLADAAAALPQAQQKLVGGLDHSDRRWSCSR